MLWNGPTRIGNYNEGIRIPEPVHQRLDARRSRSSRSRLDPDEAFSNMTLLTHAIDVEVMH
ncbi:hypothetical protein [Streptomyces sp. NPDC048428]|uniref:hypothetical protein n=1 Tax=Streptomyces sp. NPDC048428 TaxID=3154503 RepID=UPI003422C32E